MKQVSWGTRLGFYSAAVGSAFGLSNLWRFPYIVEENGGGAFVLVYILLAFAVGCSLLIGELMLGKSTRQSIFAAMSLGVGDKPSAWRFVGAAAVLMCVVVLSYYSVMSGWVLHFVMQFTIRFATGQLSNPMQILENLRGNGLLQLALTSVHLLLTLIVVLKGVEQGLEKWMGYIMPVFGVLSLLLIISTMSLPTADEALRFLFYPNFSQFGFSSLIQALGHVFFTLSIGFGSMVTFGSYLRQGESLTGAAFRVTLLDTLISLMAGVLIFPIVLNGTRSAEGGPEALFQNLPLLLQTLDFGFVFALAFFLSLYLAALAASIGLLECIVSNLMDRFDMSRRKASWLGGAASLSIGVFPAAATSVLRHWTRSDHSLLETLDDILINWCLPLVALMITLYVGYVLPESVKLQEFKGEASTAKLYSNWRFIMRYLAPGLIAGALLLQVAGILF